MRPNLSQDSFLLRTGPNNKRNFIEGQLGLRRADTSIVHAVAAWMMTDGQKEVENGCFLAGGSPERGEIESFTERALASRM